MARGPGAAGAAEPGNRKGQTLEVTAGLRSPAKLAEPVKLQRPRRWKWGLGRSASGAEGAGTASAGDRGSRPARVGLKPHTRAVLPLRMQRVQTFIRRLWPLTVTRTVCRLGANTRRVWRLEWLTWLPVAEPFPQISQRRAMALNLLAMYTA